MSTQEAQQSGAAEQRGGADAPGEQEPGAMGWPGGEGASSGSGQPSEEELRAAYEAELSHITSADMVLQATVSLLNIGARRLGLLGGHDPAAAPQASLERDLEQVRDAIDAVRGLMGVIERRAPQEARPLREALSQLQMAYAREAQAGAPAQGAPAAAPTAGATPPGRAAEADRAGGPETTEPSVGPAGGKPGPGPAESSGRLWVPGR